jgi:hypothetical protein
MREGRFALMEMMMAIITVITMITTITIITIIAMMMMMMMMIATIITMIAMMMTTKLAMMVTTKIIAVIVTWIAPSSLELMWSKRSSHFAPTRVERQGESIHVLYMYSTCTAPIMKFSNVLDDISDGESESNGATHPIDMMIPKLTTNIPIPSDSAIIRERATNLPISSHDAYEMWQQAKTRKTTLPRLL